MTLTYVSIYIKSKDGKDLNIVIDDETLINNIVGSREYARLEKLIKEHCTWKKIMKN